MADEESPAPPLERGVALTIECGLIIDCLDFTGVVLDPKLLASPVDLLSPGSWRGVSGKADLSRGVWDIVHAATGTSEDIECTWSRECWIQSGWLGFEDVADTCRKERRETEDRMTCMADVSVKGLWLR